VVDVGRVAPERYGQSAKSVETIPTGLLHPRIRKRVHIMELSVSGYQLQILIVAIVVLTVGEFITAL
jgi:hypothetical protein